MEHTPSSTLFIAAIHAETKSKSYVQVYDQGRIGTDLKKVFKIEIS